MARKTGVINNMWCDKRLSLAKYKSMSYQAITIEPFKINNGKFLSPEEALTALKTKVDSTTFVAVIMLSSLVETEFINQLTSLSQCWDLPEIKKALRLAETVRDLETTKMIIPSPADRKVVKQLSSGNTRAIINSQTLNEAQKEVKASIDNVMSELNNFASQKKAILSEIASKTEQLTGGSVDINFFYGLPSDLFKEMPNKEHIFTFLLAFSDNDLTAILDLIYDRNIID